MRKIFNVYFKKLFYYVSLYVLFMGFAFGTEKFIPVIMDDITVFVPQKISTVTVSHNGFSYSTVVSPYTGKIWLDRNLGASRVCKSSEDILCYGDYYQWGRNYDGHQNFNSPTSNILATSINNTGNNFIIVQDTMTFDWIETSVGLRSDNWSKADGSSVCPIGFRVPTMSELTAETISKDVGAFAHFLKMPFSGYREGHTGDLYSKGSWGHVWTSSIYAFGASALYFSSSNSFTDLEFRSFGLSVRCIKD